MSEGISEANWQLRWGSMLQSASVWAGLLFLTGASLGQPSPQISVSLYNHGLVVHAPNDAAYSKRHGLRLTVDSRWPTNYGYRPIRLTISSGQPTKSAHRITFRLRVEALEQPAIQVEQSFDMPRGATDAEAVVRLPQLYEDGACEWKVWVDGVRDPELCAGQNLPWQLNAFGAPRSMGAPLSFVIVEPNAHPNVLLESRTDPFAATTFSPFDLPTQWIDYSPIDVIAIAPSELTLLEATRPEAVAALRLWLRAGGQLWVHSVGEKWDHLDNVERVLGIDPTRPPPPADADESEPASKSDRDAFARGWKPIPIGRGEPMGGVTVQHVPTGRVRVVSDPTVIARLKLDPDYVVNEATTGETPASAATESLNSARWYLQRKFGLGYVRILRGTWDPVGFSISWQMLGGGGPNQPPFDPPPATPVSEAVETTYSWPERHGLSPDMANADFADFLIPGVGLAPVTEFRVMITLFVLAIGPLNYWLLMRANRLHLLLLTVPALALGLTTALFGYAMLSDGLSTKVRVRSFTSLDQATGEAACWARLSYYAGLAPGGGLALSDDVAFYPIPSGWDGTGDGDSDHTRTLEWRDGKQLLPTGWLRSRVPTQFLSVRSRMSTARVDIRQTGDRLTAENKLGTQINYLAVIDEAGNVFTSEAIDADSRRELQPSSHYDALRVLREAVLTNQPEMPPELATSHDRDSFSQRRRRRLFRRADDAELGVERLSENVLNTAITDLTAANAEGVLNVPLRSYIAITLAGPEVELGLGEVDEEASFHVLLGSW